MACHACASLPAPIQPRGVLHLSAGEEVLRETLAAALGPEARLLAPGLYAWAYEEGDLAPVLTRLGTDLGPDAQSRIRYVVLAEDEPLDFSAMGRLEPLTHLLARVEVDWLVELIRDERLTTHFQPIVHTDQPGQIYAHECLLRGVEHDGSIVNPGRLFGAARDGNLLFNLDRLARLSAIKCAHDAGVSGRIFVNFNPTSIYNPTACLGSTFAAVKKAGLDPKNIVFEVVESDHIADKEHLSRIVDRYREAGFAIALDDLGAGYAGLDLLQSLKPDYVKLDMNLVRNIHEEPFKQHIVAHLLAMARDLGVMTVAEGIECEAELDFVRKHGADLAQGYLLGRPAAIPRPQSVALALAA